MLLTYLTCMLKIAIFLQTPHRRLGTFPAAKKWKKQEFPTCVQNNGGDCAHSSHSFASAGLVSFSSGRDIPCHLARVTFARGGKTIPFLPPAAPFLSTAKEMGERTPPKTHGFWISFRRLPVCSDSSEMLNRRISLSAAAFTLKCAGVQLCILQLYCSPPRGEGFQREGTRTSRSLWPVGGMGFLRERGNRNPLSLKPFFGHFLSAKKVTENRPAPEREISLTAAERNGAAGGKKK